MAVKELLKKQDSSFISLHELLTEMTQLGDGATYEEAAAALYRTVVSEHFIWRVGDSVRGIRKASTKEEKEALDCLEMAARYNLTSVVWSADDDIPF